MKKFFGEFKKFALRGNVLDLAIGVVMGSAFTAIVTSLVKDIISPLIGLFVRTNFSDLYLDVLGVKIAYGSFIMAVVNFIIIALVLFIIIRAVNKVMNKKQHEKAPETKICPYCKTEININATRCPHCTSQLSDAE